MYDALEKHMKDHHTCKWCNFRPFHEEQIARNRDGTMYWLHWKEALETHEGHCAKKKREFKKLEKREDIMKQKDHTLALEYCALRFRINDDVLRQINELI